MEIVLFLLVALVFIVGLFYLGSIDYKRMKAESDKRIETMDSICKSLHIIEDKLGTGSWLRDKRNKYTCFHCHFLEQCMLDAKEEGINFDFLLCENCEVTDYE